jgi:hypothetical protein
VSALQRSVTDADARVEEAVRGKDQEIERWATYLSARQSGLVPITKTHGRCTNR